MPTPAPKADTKSHAKAEAAIAASIEAWVTAQEKADQLTGSAKWVVVLAVNKAHNEGMTEKEIRKVVQTNIDERFGAGASKEASRRVEVTRIMALGCSATPEQFKKWKSNKTGFHSAYTELTKKPERQGPQSWTAPTADGSGTPDPTGDTSPATENVSESLTTSKKDVGNKGNAKDKDKSHAKDDTAAMATRFCKDHKLFLTVVGQMVEFNDIDPQMLVEIFKLVEHKTPITVRSFGEIYLQESDYFYKFVKKFIEDNPQIW